MMAYGAYQTLKADSELKKLSNEQIPEFKLTPSSQALVDMGKYGYTPQETAVFYSNLSQNENAAYRQTIEKTGSNFGGAAFAAINTKKFGAISQFISNDAALKRANMKTAAGIEQGISNKNTEVSLKDLWARQQGWGQSKQAGINNMFMGMAVMGGNKTTPTDTTTAQKSFTSMFGANPADAALGAVKGGAAAANNVTNPVQEASWMTGKYTLDKGTGWYNADTGYKSPTIGTEGVTKTKKEDYGSVNNFNDYGAIFNY